jgi:hypothetical protein
MDGGGFFPYIVGMMNLLPVRCTFSRRLIAPPGVLGVPAVIRLSPSDIAFLDIIYNELLDESSHIFIPS